MATATVGLTYTRVNLTGQLFHLTPNDTPLLSAIGGLGAGRSVNSKTFVWQTQTNASVSQPAIVEGADPSYSEVTPSEVSNTVQIFQKGVEVSYTTLGTYGMLENFATRVWSVGEPTIKDWRAYQLMLKLALVKQEVEYSMLNGAYQYPTDNNTGRKMRGMRAAITTNLIDRFASLTNGNTVTFDYTGGAAEDLWTASGGAHGLAVGDEVQFTAVGTGADEYAINTPYWVVTVNSSTTFQLSATKGGSVLEGTADSSGTWTMKKATKLVKADLDQLIRQMVSGQSVVAPLNRPVLMTGAYHKQQLSDIYGYAPMSATVGGVAIDTLRTDFIANLGIVFNRWLLPGELMLLDLAHIKPVFLAIPGYPLMGAEQLAKTGAAEHWQIYGEVGIEYGPQQFHGMIKGLATAA